MIVSLRPSRRNSSSDLELLCLDLLTLHAMHMRPSLVDNFSLWAGYGEDNKNPSTPGLYLN